MSDLVQRLWSFPSPFLLTMPFGILSPESPSYTLVEPTWWQHTQVPSLTPQGRLPNV